MKHKLIMENWRKAVNESSLDMYAMDLKKFGLSIEDYKRFAKIYQKRMGSIGTIPIERFIESMKDPEKRQYFLQLDPSLDKTTKDFPSDGMVPSTYDGSTHAGGKEQRFSSAPPLQRVEKMYNALRQMDGQLVGAKYESALAAMNELLADLRNL